MRKIIALAALSLLVPVISHAKTLEELLVEKGVITRNELRGATHDGGSKVYWNEGSRLEFPDTGFTLKVNTQIQTRYTFTDNDSETGGPNTSSFEVRRARIIMSGTALNKEFSYVLQTDFVGDNNGGHKSPELRDAYIRWNACDNAWVQMGQFKTGVSRQFNNSSSKLQFPDRSVVSDNFDLDRNQGASTAVDLADGKVTLGAQIFNGLSSTEDGGSEGINSVGRDTKHTGVVTARANVLGEMDPFEEGDVNTTEEMAINVGAAYAYSELETDIIAGATEDVDLQNASLDANLKFQGLSVHGEFFWADVENDDGTVDRSPVGGYAQAGYFVQPETLEIAGRYGYLDCDDGGTISGACSGNTDDANEVGLSINYFWWKHSLKAQLAYTFINRDSLEKTGDDDIDEENTSKWIFQVSSYF